MRFRLHWFGGRTEEVTGETIADAFIQAGHEAHDATFVAGYDVLAEDTLHTGPLAVVLDAVMTADLAAKDAAAVAQEIN